MSEKLKKKKVAILVTNGFEEVELTEPKKMLESEGIRLKIVSNEPKIKSWYHGKWNKDFEVDELLDNAKAEDFDALLLPGGVINPDKLRRNDKAVAFVKHFAEKNKPIAAICHGPQMLIEADAVKERTLTSFFSIRKDLENAGATWINADAVIDENLVTSRQPADIHAFCKRFMQVIEKSA